MIRSIAKACFVAMSLLALLALASNRVSADPLTNYDSAGCTYYGPWPDVGGRAVCWSDTKICNFTSETWGVSMSCRPI